MKQFTTSQNARTGFTLIEVLIGIIVLGLGLLGLAAVFPAVVVQQRQASDAIEGETLVESAKAYLRSSMALTARVVEVASYQAGSPPSGLFRAIRDVQVGNDGSVTAFGMDGRWVLPIPGGDWNGITSPIQIQQNGDLGIYADYNYGSRTYQAIYSIPVTDRLIPSVSLEVTPPNGTPLPRPESVQPDPRFVWDFMLRRNVATPDQPSASDTITAAVFVRRLDSAIRRRPGQTLAQMFADRNNPEQVLPVSANPDTGEQPSSTRETRIYSPILFANLSFPTGGGGVNATTHSTIAVNFQGDALEEIRRQMVSQVGQKLVSRSGVVHTVVRVFENPLSSPPNALTINVEPAFNTDTEGVDGVGYPIWFTPQIPVAVEVFDVTVR